MRRLVAPWLLCPLLLAGCGDPGTSSEGNPRDRAPREGSATSSSTPAPTAGATRSAPPAGTPSGSPSGSPAAPAPARPLRGVDVSHHQGGIDWARVRRDRIAFAYLKASEGSTFTDPRFSAHARAARAAGLRVGGYHYFTLCSPGTPQAEHFVDVLGGAGVARGAGTLPPAIDLELLGNCAGPPPPEELLREVRAFVELVERRTGQEVVVYAYPDLEQRYGIAAALGRRLWVRRLGDVPPAGDWWMWQRSQEARVDGIDGPVDLDVLAP